MAIGTALLANAMGLAGVEPLRIVIDQIVSVTTAGREPNQWEIDFVVKMATVIALQEEVETTLAIQMVAAHMTAMQHVRMMHHAETIPQLEILERTFSKLIRTFVAQAEALWK